jgi:hypothetical protein
MSARLHVRLSSLRNDLTTSPNCGMLTSSPPHRWSVGLYLYSPLRKRGWCRRVRDSPLGTADFTDRVVMALFGLQPENNGGHPSRHVCGWDRLWSLSTDRNKRLIGLDNPNHWKRIWVRTLIRTRVRRGLHKRRSEGFNILGQQIANGDSRSRNSWNFQTVCLMSETVDFLETIKRRSTRSFRETSGLTRNGTKWICRFHISNVGANGDSRSRNSWNFQTVCLMSETVDFLETIKRRSTRSFRETSGLTRNGTKWICRFHISNVGEQKMQMAPKIC